MKKLLPLLAWYLFTHLSQAQVDLSYYLPNVVTYDPKVPTPEEIMGHEVGEWHVTHDKLVYYMKAIADASPRATFMEIGVTHEDRQQFWLIVTSPTHHNRLEEIRQQHVQLTDPAKSGDLDISSMPAVVLQGFSIHGNEASACNAAVLAAYFYAAAQGPLINSILDNTVILIDPAFNPDGVNRFASWVNTHRAKNLVSDPNNIEQNEMWPRGRTNHYNFDLNRDWLMAQQPESRNRVYHFHRWKPNIVTDHHEMGPNSTFFFQPGIPSRKNPNTPDENVRLTTAIAQFHAAALDSIGSLYYSEEDFDDFFYGKGSTFPDVQGAIGILFEQASSRGHSQESDNGILTFPFTIKNQFNTIISTVKAAVALREELLTYQRDFYREALSEAQSNAQKGIVFGSQNDSNRAWELAQLLLRQQINVQQLEDDITVSNTNYPAASSFVVPTDQPQSKMIKAVFETMTTFQDSLFYDISTWTLPLAFNLNYDNLDARQMGSIATKDLALSESPERSTTDDESVLAKSTYAYVVPWDDYYAPKALWQLMEADVRVKVATEPILHEGKRFERGALVIPLGIQTTGADLIYSMLNSLRASLSIPVHSLNTGNTQGVNLGSRTLEILEKPAIAMLVEDGVSSYDAGEIWHLLDNRFDIPISRIPMRIFNRVDLNRYNTLIMANGNYGRISSSKVEEITKWVQKGGRIIAFKGANSWLAAQSLIQLTTNGTPTDTTGRKDYQDLREYRGAQVTGGAIFETDLDTSHPIGFGYEDRSVPVFVNSNLLFQAPKNPYATPLKFTNRPLLSGYVSEENLERIGNKAAVIVSANGRGRIISFSFNPNFRAFWYGTNKLFLNAIFFGNLIESGSAAR
ncbi:MAG: M14 family metallopeptidase [Bacteroidota bacterium]